MYVELFTYMFKGTSIEMDKGQTTGLGFVEIINKKTLKFVEFCHVGFQIPFQNFHRLSNSLRGISQRLSCTFLAAPSSCPTVFKSISQQLSA
jgi:hypothetical protein